MPDEVKKYKGALEQAIERWQEKTQKELKLDLGPLAKQIEDLGKSKNSGGDQKQLVDLRKQAAEIIEKRMKTSLPALNTTVKKVERPEDLDDKQSNVLDGQLKELSDDFTELEIDESLKQMLKLKDISISVNLDDKGLIVAKKWSFGK